MFSLIWLEIGQSLDLTALASDIKLSTGLHGFADLSAFVRCDPIAAFYYYNRPGLPRLLISDGATTIYDGRLEDVAIVAGGVRLKALGYARALEDTLYTATHTAAATSAVAAALVGSVSGINAGQLSASTALIDTNALTVTETYNDLRPAAVLDKLAGYGDTGGNLWEWGVYEAQALWFRRRGSVSQAWFVDAFDLELEQSLDKLYNSAYATYTNGTNTTNRTAAVTDANSIAGSGLTRQGLVNSNAKAAAAAGYEAATFLADHKDAASRARIAFNQVFDTTGQRAPLYAVRAGDTITVRNIPATASGQVDRLRKFYVALTNYDADANVLTVEPSLLTPTLAAQISAGSGSAQGGVDPRVYIDPANTVTFAGVKFGAGTDALDNYDIDPWTPTFQGTTISGVFTYGANNGTYLRFGNIVVAIAQLNITAIGTPPTGNMVIGGLPFPAAATHYYGGVAFGIIDNFNYTAAALALTGRVVPGEAIIRLYEVFDNAGNAAVPAANFTNANCNIALVVVYKV